MATKHTKQWAYCAGCDAWRLVAVNKQRGLPKTCPEHRAGKPYRGTVSMDANGYMRKRRGPKMPTEYEHRIVWEDAHGPIPAGYHIHHKNHVRDDNRLENLELVDGRRHNADHTRERHTAGQMAVGRDKALWRHDIDDEYIARRYREGASLRQIGREVGATHNVVTAHLQHLGLR